MRQINSRFRWAVVVVALLVCQAAAAQQASYYPGRWDEWERRAPEQVNLDAARLNEAIAFAKAHYSPQRRDKNGAAVFGTDGEPYGEIIGPTKERGASNGLIVRHGYIVAEWGDTSRVDMTFSVTKTYLSTTAGLALDRGLIRDVHDRVRDYAPDAGFDSEHNAQITWHQLLNQTSGWQGALWGKPDWADRFNGTRRPSEPPGKHWRYNDVRVNQLALALLHVWRKPLPQVLKELVMDPLGASPTWRWHGYDNSWVTIDGAQMQSVSGGGHWGGGMFISSRDHARLPVPAPRRVERPSDHFRRLDRARLDAHRSPAQLRLHELVPQHQPQAVSQRAGDQHLFPGSRDEHDLAGPGP